jgi:hypothetical protein
MKSGFYLKLLFILKSKWCGQWICGTMYEFSKNIVYPWTSCEVIVAGHRRDFKLKCAPSQITTITSPKRHHAVFDRAYASYYVSDMMKPHVVGGTA